MTSQVNQGIDAEMQNFYDGLLTSARQMKKGQTKPVSLLTPGEIR
jgi:hypothetical protein